MMTNSETRDQADQENAPEQTERDSENQNQEGERSGTLEKIFTVLSLGLIIALVGFLSWKIGQENEPPAFEIILNEPQPRGEFVGVVVAVRNSGDDTAKAVQLRGEVPGPDGKPVEAEATLEWLPGKSKRRATLLFPAQADLSQLDVNVVGYEEP